MTKADTKGNSPSSGNVKRPRSSSGANNERTGKKRKPQFPNRQENARGGGQTGRRGRRTRNRPQTYDSRPRIMQLNYKSPGSGVGFFNPERNIKERKKLIAKYKALQQEKDEYLRSKAQEDVPDPTSLVDVTTIKEAIRGVRRLAELKQKKKGKVASGLLDDDDASDSQNTIFMAITICKVPFPKHEQHLVKPITIKVLLPNSLTNESTEVVLITKDLKKGIKRDHEDTQNHFLSLLQNKDVASMVNEVITLRQLKVEYKEFEAKRHLADRTDVVLCDSTVIRFVPKFLGKHFYKKNKIPLQVDLKADDLNKEFAQALSLTHVTFTLAGNSAAMKIGRLNQTDEEISVNVLAAIKKLAKAVPGNWKNVQNIHLRLQNSKSVPIYVKLGGWGKIGNVCVKPAVMRAPVEGVITTVPHKRVTVFPEGTVAMTEDKFDGLYWKEVKADRRAKAKAEKKKEMEALKPRMKNKDKKMKATQGVQEEVVAQVSSNEKKEQTVKKKKNKATKTAEPEDTAVEPNNTVADELDELLTESTDKKTKKDKKTAKANKKKMTEEATTKAKKKKTAESDDSDSGEEALEALELAYLKKRSQKEETGTTDGTHSASDDDSDECEYWSDD